MTTPHSIHNFVPCDVCPGPQHSQALRLTHACITPHFSCAKNACGCVCMMCVNAYVNEYANACANACVNECVNACVQCMCVTHVYACMCVSACMYVYMHVCMHVCMYACVYLKLFGIYKTLCNLAWLKSHKCSVCFAILSHKIPSLAS